MPSYSVSPVIDLSVRRLCTRPYEGHPKGCPNFNSSPRCPPKVPTLDQVFDMRGPFWAVCSSFPLGEHVASMRARHPEWSQRQLSCVLYWQGTARKRLRAEIAAFRACLPSTTWIVETTPEAMGCDVTITLRSAGVVLPWPPGDVVTHVALAGITNCLHVRMCYGKKLPVRADCRHTWPEQDENWCSGCRSRTS